MKRAVHSRPSNKISVNYHAHIYKPSGLGLLIVMAGPLGLEYGSTLPLCLSKHLAKTGHISVSSPHVINRQIYGERSYSHSSDCDDGVSNEQSYLINHCCSSCLLNWSMMASSRSASVARLR